MISFFQNPIVTFISGIVFTLGGGYLFYYLTIRRKPKPEWGIYSSSPVLLGDDSINSLIKITYNGTELESLTATTIYLINKGKLSLRKADLTESIKFKFFEDVEIIDVIDIKGSNKTISVGKKTGENDFIKYDYVDLTFDYLNPNQAVSFTVLHTGYSENCFSVDVDILDAKLTKRKSGADREFIIMGIVMLLMFIVSVVLLLVFRKVFTGNFWIIPPLSATLILVITMQILLRVLRRKRKILPWEK